jgi:hypothetical protein
MFRTLCHCEKLGGNWHQVGWRSLELLLYIVTGKHFIAHKYGYLSLLLWAYSLLVVLLWVYSAELFFCGSTYLLCRIVYNNWQCQCFAQPQSKCLPLLTFGLLSLRFLRFWSHEKRSRSRCRSPGPQFKRKKKCYKL